MGIGLGIFLIALGAILTFAVDWTIGGLDLHIVGWILMIVGVGGLIMFFAFWNRRREPEAVAAVKQRMATEQPRAHDRPAPPTPSAPSAPSTVTTVTPQQPAPAQVTTVTATPPAPATSRPPQ